MQENKYLLICCLALILFAISARNVKLKEAYQTQVDGFVAQVHEESKDNDIGEEVLISDYGDPIVIATSTPEKIDPKPEVVRPYITAESYLVGNLETGDLYISLNTDEVFPIASVSKLYTALVVQHLFDQKKEITITQSMLDAYGTAGNLVLGETISTEKLMYALLLESSNDAAEAYAQSFGYEDFIEKMNSFALEIGLKKTSFADASGLSPRNISNASDLFTLAQYLYDHEKNILTISKVKEIEFATTTEHGAHVFKNINPYVFYSSFVGGKTGRTDEAKESMVSLFRQDVGSKTYPIVVIILRSDFGQREIDTEKLLDMTIEKLANNP